MVESPAVVDFHVHVNPWQMLKPNVDATLRRTQPNYEKLRGISEDPRRMLDLMDEERIERVCLINYVAPDVMGYTMDTNRWVAEYAAADRKRLVPFGGFHPGLVTDAAAAVDELLRTLDGGGVKIHPPHMLLSPNAYLDVAPGLGVLYERCEAEGVPVMFHTGTSTFPGARNKFGDPMAIDDVAVDFPKLKIVLAHGGRPLWTEAATFLVRRHPNVWLEISSVPPASLLDYFPSLERMADRCLWGSDWPGPHVPGMRANADAFLRLPISDGAKRKILSENARRVLSG